MGRLRVPLQCFGGLFAFVLWSVAAAAPAAPALNAPADSAKNQTLTPALTWAAVSGATSYHVQVSASADFATTISDQTTVTGTSTTVSSGLTNSTITFGTPTNDGRGGGSWNDMPLAYFVKPDGVTLRSWHYFCGGGQDIIEGTLATPTANGVGSYSFSLNGASHECVWAAFGPYQVNGDTLISVCHIEDNDQTEYPYGLSVSFNMGTSWTYCGDISRPSSTSLTRNIGGGPLLRMGDYLYAIHNSGQVLRAQADSVFMMAKQKKVTTWRKYNNGTWTNSAITGDGSSCFSGDTHCKATYVGQVGTYLLGINGGSTAKVLASTNLTTWGNSYTIFSGGNPNPYGAFVQNKAGGARNDQSEQWGLSFYYIWTAKNLNGGGYNDDTFKRSLVTIVPKVYYWRVAATDATGAGAWSTVRRFTTAALITGGTPVTAPAPSNIFAESTRDFSLKLRRVGSDRLTMNFTLPARAATERTSILIYDVQGKLVSALHNVDTRSGAFTTEMDATTMRSGRYVVQIKAGGMDQAFPVTLAQ